MKSPLFSLSFVVLLVGGCAAISGEGHLLTEDSKAASTAKPCCRDLPELLSRTRPIPAEPVSLGPSGDHYDFGLGLAPVAVFSLGREHAGLELVLVSGMRQRGWVEGGDGLAHYANAIALFYDSTGRQLPAETGSSVQVATSNGRALRKTFRVPPGCMAVIVTVDPRDTGKTDSSVIKNEEARPLIAGRSVFFLPGGLLPVSYRLASYGPVTVQLAEAGKAKQ